MAKTPLTARLLDTLMELQEEVLNEAIPEQTRSHFRSARREALLGIRSLIDEAIERTQERPGGQGAAAQGPGKHRDAHGTDGTIPIED
ncbi:hypothetical protein ACP26L_31510 [Paenibacillus sp. S-38]|uniref:hypothetical protein n=1 Tax=Paenibacillus sp. S-38 TaxID=3416710 RepID=UPI003CEBF4CF